MKKIVTIIAIFISSCILYIFTGCSDMNDLHDVYLKDGERLYLGKIDSAHTFPGDERVLIRYWVSDPRIKSVIFSWVPMNDSIKINVERTTLDTDSFDVVIGGETGIKSISEGNYVFKIVTSNNDGDLSLPVEKILKVYGEDYRSSLLQRLYRSYSWSDNSLIVNWREGEIESLYTEISYIDTSGNQIIKQIENIELIDTLINFPSSGVFKHRTAYKPVSESIDIFYTDYTEVQID